MAQIRKNALEVGHYYHIYNRSIAGFRIFDDSSDCERIYELLDLYRYTDFNYKYSAFCDLEDLTQLEIEASLKVHDDRLVDIIAYCIMPTHFHLLLRQIKEGGISKYLSRVSNGYARYFNTRHHRQGPLWSGRFKSVLVSNDEQLLHLTRYIHLNPTSASLVDEPSLWKYSSFNHYISNTSNSDSIVTGTDIVGMNSNRYRKFVLNRKSYQRELSKIKALIIDEYSG